MYADPTRHPATLDGHKYISCKVLTDSCKKCELSNRHSCRKIYFLQDSCKRCQSSKNPTKKCNSRKNLVRISKETHFVSTRVSTLPLGFSVLSNAVSLKFCKILFNQTREAFSLTFYLLLKKQLDFC